MGHVTEPTRQRRSAIPDQMISSSDPEIAARSDADLDIIRSLLVLGLPGSRRWIRGENMGLDGAPDVLFRALAPTFEPN